MSVDDFERQETLPCDALCQREELFGDYADALCAYLQLDSEFDWYAGMARHDVDLVLAQHGEDQVMGLRRRHRIGMRLDLTAIGDAEAGDEVVLIGRQGSGQIGLAEVCAARGATPSDIAMAIGPAVLRAYHAGGG